MSREQDLIEENNAASALIRQLAGRPLLQTSGDEEHRLNPTSVKIEVKLSENGDELNFHIAQTDRHHPHLMRDTVIKALEEMPELREHSPKALDPHHDYNPDTNSLTIRYDLPKGKADNIIHSLSERGKIPIISGQIISGDNPNSWTNRIEQAAKRQPEQKEQSWVAGVIQFFTGNNNSRA